MLEWVRLPTKWIEAQGLKEFRWAQGAGANNIAALMALIAIAHNADQEAGLALVTYNDLANAIQLSEAKISAGLKVLIDKGLIVRDPTIRSLFQLCNYDRSSGWGKLPGRQLYRNGVIAAFNDFRLRRPSELNALKLLLLFVSRRDQNSNLANISYDKITEYTGMDRSRIKEALSILAVHGLVHIERLTSDVNGFAVSNAYRVAHLEPYNHMGTRGRALQPIDTDLF